MAIFIYRPTTTDVDDGWSLTGEATAHECVDPGDPVTHDDDTTYVSRTTSPTGAYVLGLSGNTAFAEQMIAINSVKVKGRAKRTNAGANNHCYFRIRLASNSVGDDTTILNTWTEYEWDFTNDRPGGGSWLPEDIRDGNFRWDFVRKANGPAVRLTSLWVEIDYVAASALVEPSRRIGSRKLRMMRKAMNIFEIDTKDLEFLNRQPGDIVNISHFAIPHASASGASVAIDKWQRVPCYLLGMTFMPMTRSVRLTLLDVRDYLVSFWDTGITDLSASSQRDGIAALDAGLTRTFSRDSGAWVEDPGDGRIVSIGNQQEKNAADGFLLEKSAINKILNSCNDDGVASDWSTQNTGVNGSAVEDDTTDLFWDSGETAQSIKITAGDPLGGSPVGIYQTAAEYAADSVVTVSVTHKDDDAAPIEVEIVRDFDGEYWNAATPGWQAGAVTNALTVRASELRDQINNIDVGSDATTLTITIIAHDTNGQVNHVYDVQCEESAYATSRILTNGAAVTREDDALTYSNDSGARMMFPDRGTAFFRVNAQWSTADLPSGAKMTVYYCAYDANNEEHIYYDEASGAWIFERTIATTVYQATKTTTVTKGTALDIAFRWTSDEGELGLADYTMSIFVDGVKGTDDDAAAHGAVADCDMEVGRTAADTDMLDGFLTHMMFTPIVYTDERIARLP